MSMTPFDAALLRVLEVLALSGAPAVENSLSGAHILSYADFIGARERIEESQISGLPKWALDELLSAIAWHDNFRERNGHDPDVLASLTVPSFKAFQAERAEDAMLSQLIPQYRSLANSHSPDNITRAAGIHSQILSTKNGMPKMIQMDTDTIMQRLPHRIKSLSGIIETAKFVKLIVQCIRSQSDTAAAETLKKIVIMGRTQVGKSGVKAILIVTSVLLGYPLIIITKGNAERDDLTRKLTAYTEDLLDEDENLNNEPVVSNFPTTENIGQISAETLARPLRNGRAIVIADTPGQVKKIVDSLILYRRGNPCKKFLLCIDECDAMFRTDNHTQAFERAYDNLVRLRPCAHVFVSATPLPALIHLANEELLDGIPVVLFDITPSDDYVGLARMKPFQLDGEPVYLGKDELKPKRGCGFSFSVDDKEYQIPSCSERLRDFYASAIASKGRGILLLDCTMYFVKKEEINVELKAELVQLYAHAILKKQVAVFINTGGLGMQVKLSTGEPWIKKEVLDDLIDNSDNSEDTMLGKVIQFIHTSVGTEAPIFGFGFHKMFRSNSYRSSDRVPTHITVSLGEFHNLSTVTQALGRATFNGKSKLLANGFENVTLLTKEADRNAALSLQRINDELCRLKNQEERTLSNALKIVSAKNSVFLEKSTRNLGPLDGCREMLQRFATSPGSAMYPQVQKSLHFQRKEEHSHNEEGDDLVDPINRRGLKRKRQEGQEME